MKPPKKSNSVELAGKFLSTSEKRRNRLIAISNHYHTNQKFHSIAGTALFRNHPNLTFKQKKTNQGGVYITIFRPSKHRTQKGSNTWMVSNQPIWKNMFVDLDIFGSISPNFQPIWKIYVRQIWINFPQIFGMKKSKHVWKPAPTP